MTARRAAAVAAPDDSDLLYGQLLTVGSELLRRRYNDALEALCGRRTGLAHFRIDLSGFSPEVAKELGDPHYLNPHRCNRKFILLSLDQRTLPLIDATFTSSADILRQFMEDNREALFALTLRDVVYGELENSVYKVATIQDVVSLKSIRVSLATSGNLISKAEELERRIAAFEKSDTAWSDDAEIAAMIALAEITGDIRRHPLKPAKRRYNKGNFFSPHLGGVYVFRDGPHPTVITCGQAAAGDAALTEWLEDGPARIRHICLQSREAVAAFLHDEGLVAALDQSAAQPVLDDLRQSLYFLVVDHVAKREPGRDFTAMNAEALKQLIYPELDALPPAFHTISDALRRLEQGAGSPPAGPDDPGYFYLLRPRRHDDRELVGHLLSRLAPFDLRRMFLFNKALFRRRYQAWTASQRDYVARDLRRHCLPDEEAARAARYADGAAKAGRGKPPRSRIPASSAEKKRRPKKRRGPWSRRDDD